MTAPIELLTLWGMNLRSFRVVDVDAGVIFVLFACLFGAGVIWSKDADTLSLAIWALASAWSCYFVLDAFNYFEAFKPMPSRGNFFTLVLTLPWGPMGTNFFLSAFLGQGIVRYRGIFLITPVAAIIVLLFQYCSGKFFRRRDRTRKILPLLSDKDLAELKEEIRSNYLQDYFEWIDASKKSQADLIVVSRTGTREFSSHTGLLQAHLDGVPIVDIRILLAELRGRIAIENTDLWLYLQTASPQSSFSRVYLQLKSHIEPALAVSLASLLAPLFVIIALGVKLSSPGPIFFRQVRTGYRGKTFHLYKFRTMTEAAPGAPATWANADQHRITAFGRFLRLSHLDEIPQLFNIAMGELGFVGPRPERPEFYALLKEAIPLFYLRTMVRPGVTGWAQVMAGYAGSVEESRRKLEYDLYYMQHLSARLDIMVLIKTALVFLRFTDPKAK